MQGKILIFLGCLQSQISMGINSILFYALLISPIATAYGGSFQTVTSLLFWKKVLCAAAGTKSTSSPGILAEVDIIALLW